GGGGGSRAGWLAGLPRPGLRGSLGGGGGRGGRGGAPVGWGGEPPPPPLTAFNPSGRDGHRRSSGNRWPRAGGRRGPWPLRACRPSRRARPLRSRPERRRSRVARQAARAKRRPRKSRVGVEQQRQGLVKLRSPRLLQGRYGRVDAIVSRGRDDADLLSPGKRLGAGMSPELPVDRPDVRPDGVL